MPHELLRGVSLNSTAPQQIAEKVSLGGRSFISDIEKPNDLGFSP